jgi:glycosyltransferase involved in cell wall biosynthesis
MSVPAQAVEPRSCTEAMSLGLPVVASRVCGMDEVVVEGETGFLAEPGSVDGLAVELQRALDSRARREALGAAARRRFDERFDGNRSIRTLLDRHYGLAAAAPAVGAAGAGASP